MELENKIAVFIIKEVMLKTSCMNWCVNFEEVEQEFNIKLTDTLINNITECINSFSDVVSDIILENNCFDVCIYTFYAKCHDNDDDWDNNWDDYWSTHEDWNGGE